MTAGALSVLLASDHAAILRELPRALHDLATEVHCKVLNAGQRIDDADPFDAVVLAPSVHEDTSSSAWSAVADVLARQFESMQAAVQRLQAAGAGGHLVILLPSEPAIGDASRPAASALAGGMLTLVRTAALELQKIGMTCNAVLYEDSTDRSNRLQEVAALVETLARQRKATLTGQHIFACSGADVGRLHP